MIADTTTSSGLKGYLDGLITETIRSHRKRGRHLRCCRRGAIQGKVLVRDIKKDIAPPPSHNAGGISVHIVWKSHSRVASVSNRRKRLSGKCIAPING